jgi:hypothetical protein
MAVLIYLHVLTKCFSACISSNTGEHCRELLFTVNSYFCCDRIMQLRIHVHVANWKLSIATEITRNLGWCAASILLIGIIHQKNQYRVGWPYPGWNCTDFDMTYPPDNFYALFYLKDESPQTTHEKTFRFFSAKWKLYEKWTFLFKANSRLFMVLTSEQLQLVKHLANRTMLFISEY